MGRNWSRKSIEEIAKNVAKGIKSKPIMTIMGVRQWGYPTAIKASSYNEPWGTAYFADVERTGPGSYNYTIYLPLPIFNGSIDNRGFVDKGLTGENIDYDPTKGQLIFLYNNACIYPYFNPRLDNEKVLRREAHLDYWPFKELHHSYEPSSTQTSGCSLELYHASRVGTGGAGLNPGEVIELGDKIVEYKAPTTEQFYLYRNSFRTDIYDTHDNSEFYVDYQKQLYGYSDQALKYLEAPDDWNHYNITGTTYAFNSDKSSSIDISGRGLPSAAVQAFSNSGILTQKIFAAGTLLNELLFTTEYDTLKTDNNGASHVVTSAVLKISFNSNIN